MFFFRLYVAHQMSVGFVHTNHTSVRCAKPTCGMAFLAATPLRFYALLHSRKIHRDVAHPYIAMQTVFHRDENTTTSR